MNAQERSFHDAQVRAARHKAAMVSRSLTLAIEFEHDMTRLASRVEELADAIDALAILTQDSAGTPVRLKLPHGTFNPMPPGEGLDGEEHNGK